MRGTIVPGETLGEYRPGWIPGEAHRSSSKNRYVHGGFRDRMMQFKVEMPSDPIDP